MDDKNPNNHRQQRKVTPRLPRPHLPLPGQRCDVSAMVPPPLYANWLMSVTIADVIGPLCILRPVVVNFDDVDALNR